MNKSKNVQLGRMDKVLMTMYEISKGEHKKIKFEDLVVAVFLKYPDHFNLRGYPKYPDSEALNNTLYHNLKKKGYIAYGNKTFSLTDKGEDYVIKLKELVDNNNIVKNVRFDRYIEREINRIKRLDSLSRFYKKEFDSILDVDFYEFLGVTVRTEKTDFLSRLNIIKEIVDNLKDIKEEDYKLIKEFCKYMMKKFDKEMNYKIQ